MKNLKNNLSEEDTLINKNLGLWLRQERKKCYFLKDGKKKPITQTMIAKELGVTFQQIQKYEISGKQSAKKWYDSIKKGVIK
jgi:hypothetical protein